MVHDCTMSMLSLIHKYINIPVFAVLERYLQLLPAFRLPAEFYQSLKYVREHVVIASCFEIICVIIPFIPVHFRFLHFCFL